MNLLLKWEFDYWALGSCDRRTHLKAGCCHETGILEIKGTRKVSIWLRWQCNLSETLHLDICFYEKVFETSIQCNENDEILFEIMSSSLTYLVAHSSSLFG